MKLGFIGLGNMNGAILKGILKSRERNSENILGSDVDKKLSKDWEETWDIQLSENNVELAKNSDVIFIGVKPFLFEKIIEEIKDSLTKDVILVSITPAFNLSWLEEKLGFGRKIVWTIPNIPSSVGEGMTGISCNEHVTEKDRIEIEKLFESIGKVEFVSEDLMTTLAATASTTPAYLAMMIEAMADGAVLEGMPRKTAYQLIAQTFIGTGKLVLEGLHPAEIKDQVCSPGGITIQGVEYLEEENLRDLMMKMISIPASSMKSED